MWSASYDHILLLPVRCTLRKMVKNCLWPLYFYRLECWRIDREKQIEREKERQRGSERKRGLLRRGYRVTLNKLLNISLACQGAFRQIWHVWRQDCACQEDTDLTHLFMQTYIKCLNLCQSLEIILKAQEIFSEPNSLFVLRHTGQDKN